MVVSAVHFSKVNTHLLLPRCASCSVACGSSCFRHNDGSVLLEAADEVAQEIATKLLLLASTFTRRRSAAGSPPIGHPTRGRWLGCVLGMEEMLSTRHHCLLERNSSVLAVSSCTLALKTSQHPRRPYISISSSVPIIESKFDHDAWLNPCHS